ncbi:methyltransferase family protein [Brevundimonas sp.]|jgi:protein-S-isoprenylcysteine O-methyltransferase Ste14|uniref:methyltransferase family protein n=1 Tax=Brevundimonas sp. TaxID=1871086 RepID=UPI003784EE6C
MTLAAAPDDRRFRLHRWLDAGERVAMLVLYGWLVWRFAASLSTTPANIMFLASEGLIAAMVLLRRPTEQISVRPMDWLTGALGAFLPMLVIPASGGLPAGAVLLAVGFLISMGAKLSLRRSFGLIAANRGVKRSGLYAVVRHPMYLGYVIAYAGTLMLNPSVWNAVLLTLWLGFEIVRIYSEEAILMRDPAYQEHAKKVRFRLIPGVW